MKLKSIFCLIVICFSHLLIYGSDKGKSYKKIAFYIVAHQDDWQLFMGEKAYRDVLDYSGTKVVFVYVTSGEAGKDSVYWQNRDKAALNCLYFIKRNAFKDSIDSRGVKFFNNHRIAYANYENTTSYYMRLPDGHGRAGVGYETYGSVSMKKFKAGEIPSMTCTDSTSTYNGWNDLVTTIQTLIKEEAADYKEVTVNFPEFDKTINANAHSDHLGTGQAVWEAVEKMHGIKKIAYVDYETQFKPVNLLNEEIMIKSALYSVYDKSIFDGTAYCTICDGKGQYTQWLFRSYFRELK